MRVIETVTGDLPVAEAGLVLAAEVLLQTAPPPSGNTGRPASESAFERAPVAIGSLGRLLLGARNRDDQTLAEADAAAALGSLAAVVRAGSADAARPVVVVLEGGKNAVGPELAPDPGRGLRGGIDPNPSPDPTCDVAALARLSSASGVAIVRRRALAADATPAQCAAAAASASDAGHTLVLTPATSLADTEAALKRLAAAGLPASRVVLTGVAALIGRRVGARDGAGVDPDRLDALIALAGETGATLCFDDLGRIPTVRTVVSDHDVALAILHCAERGIGEQLTLSCGIRAKHRLTAFGGNGLEFIAQQFLPYLGMLGGDSELRDAVGGGNALRLLARIEERVA